MFVLVIFVECHLVLKSYQNELNIYFSQLGYKINIEFIIIVFL